MLHGVLLHLVDWLLVLLIRFFMENLVQLQLGGTLEDFSLRLRSVKVLSFFFLAGTGLQWKDFWIFTFFYRSV